jgi:hypothetical protein
MITNGRINLLENIIVDNNLKKHTVKVENTPKSQGNIFISNNSTISGATTPSRVNTKNDYYDYLVYLTHNKPTLLNKTRLWVFKKLFLKPLSLKERIPLNDLISFFNSVKENTNELNNSDIKEVLDNYKILLENAENNNQVALIDRIKDYSSVLKNELIISESKFNKYLTEEDIVEFHNKASKHDKYNTCLCLTYVKNFVKVIPKEVSELKKEADELMVFDNYVVLHYDYSGKSVDDTKAEKQKKKDPILFGVISGSNRLYFIGDWIDEYCDLTLDMVIKKIGKEVNVVDKESIINNMKKI